jgi:deazaflavin-dependent oxidoreductase (nitroreductase family)
MARTGAPRGRVRRALNAAMTAALRRGLGPPHVFLLETRGRRTGELRTTPVSLVEGDDGRFLVSPYGTPAWVHHARAAGEVTLRKGRHAETLAVTELDAHAAAPVLRRYITQERIVRPWFDATPGDPDAAFAAEAARHPVFALGQSSRSAIRSTSTTYS